MSKKHQAHRASRPGRMHLPKRALVALQDAIWLADRREYATAREKLEALENEYPHQRDVLFALLDVLHEQHDMPAYLSVAQELVELVPDNPDLALNLAGAYSGNLYPVSAFRAFHQFLERFPQHPRAAEVRDHTAELEAVIPQALADVGLTEPHATQAASLHERSLALMAVGKFKAARRVVDELLALKPAFIPALNNSSNLFFVEGNLARAAELAQQVLTLEPENIQALSNLARFLCLQGRFADAQPFGAKLKTLEPERPDAETKQVEALAMLGDDAGILQVFERAEKHGRLRGAAATPFLYHVAAVAALRQGDEKRAKKLWQRALELSSTFEIARDNLDDLNQPVGERHAPWAFTLREWLPEKTIRELVTRISAVVKRGDKVITQTAQRFLRDHPEVRALIPLLLDRGDPMGREFAVQLTSAAEDADSLNALRDFAQSTRGPDALRLRAAQHAMRAGLLPSGNLRFYTRGAWQDVLLLDMEITGEPSMRLRPAAQALYEQSHEALLNNDPADAETLLRQADTLQPNEPGIRHNLAMSLEMQGRHTEAEALLRENHARHPDYLFSRAVLARLAVKARQLDQARALLEPLLRQKRFHFSEFAAFAGAQIDLLLAEGQKESARKWFDMWARLDPDNPQLAQFRASLGPLGPFWRR